MNPIVWLKNGRVYKQVENSVQVVDAIPNTVYNMCYNSITKEIYLEYFCDKFTFDFKIYGLETKLINHIMNTYHNTTRNLGVLFNGVKGTGKTITAKIIANNTNLPIILINEPFPGLADFIAKISCDCVLFFDEFEKNFDSKEGHDLELLSIMDGVFNSQYRRVFLMTTNRLSINENFIGRPSRIRYKKSFGNLPLETIKEYLDDNLKDKSRTEEIINFIDTLAISTIDILKCIVEEVNIHNCPVSEFKQFINVEQAPYKYSIIYKYADLSSSYSMEDFKKDISEIGKIDEKGEVIEEGDVDAYSTSISIGTSIDFAKVGDPIGYFGIITQTIDSNGYMISETESDKVFIKVLNHNTKPSLYRSELIF